MSDAVLGVVFGLLTMLSLGIGGAIIQSPARKLGVVQTVVLRNSVLVIGILLGMVSGFFPFTWDSAVWVPAIALGVLGYVALQFFYKGLSAGKVGVVVPIASSYTLITVLLAVVLFGESLSIVQSGAIGLIILGSILLSARLEDWKKSPRVHIHAGVIFAFLTCVGWGLWSFFLKVPVSLVGPILTSLLVEFVTLLTAGVHFLLTKKKWVSVSGDLWKGVILAGLLGSIGSFSYNFGINVADVSLVVALAACAPLASTLYAYLVFHERLTHQQWVAIFLKIVGIVFLSISS